MTSSPMRVMARVAHPLLRRGHDLVVQTTMDKVAARVHDAGELGDGLVAQARP